jgi:hypothetical protein
MMRKNNSLISIIICLLSFAILIWCEYPVSPISRKIEFPSGKLKVSDPNGPCLDSDKKPVFLQNRELSLTWEPLIRKGDTSIVRLSFLKIQPISPADTTIPLDENKTINLYDLYSVEAEARLELFDAVVNPAGLSGLVLGEGQDIDFNWVIKPVASGSVEGTTWFYLKFFQKSGCEPFEQAISAQKVSIKVISLLGLDSYFWRILGVLGLFIGLVILGFGKNWSLFQLFRHKMIRKGG